MWTLTLLVAWVCGADEVARIRDTASANAAAMTSIEFESTKRSKLKNSRFHLSTHVKFIGEGDVSRTEITSVGTPEPRIFVFDGKRYFVFNNTTGKMQPEGRWDGFEVATTFQPLTSPYFWLANPQDTFTWASVKNREVWEKRFEDASYKGTEKLPLGECDVVVLLGDTKDAVSTVYFLREAGYYPVRCVATNEARKGRMQLDIIQLQTLEVEGARCSFPKSMVMKIWESGEVAMKSTIETDRVVANPVIDRENFQVPE